jgi:hypothetical protein
MKTQIEKVDEKVQTKTKSMLKIKINSDVTTVKEIVNNNNNITAIVPLKPKVANELEKVEKSNMAFLELQGQLQEHLEISDRRFSIVQKQCKLLCQ